MPIEIRHDFTNARGRQIRRPKGDGGGMARSAAQPRSRFSASHALRWREAHLREGVPAPAQRTEFIGDGGLPIWEAGSLSRLEALPSETVKIVIQQDYRFGNRSFAEGRPATHVGRDQINALVDGLCKHRAELAIERLQRIPALIFVPWSLIGLKSRYRVRDAPYHRFWNLEEFRNSPHNWLAVIGGPDGNPDAPRGDGVEGAGEIWPDLLFCDRELHPSIIGYFWLLNVVKGEEAGAALKLAGSQFSQIAYELFADFQPCSIMDGGLLIQMPTSLKGTVLETVIHRTAHAYSQPGAALNSALALEESWSRLASSILKFRTSKLPAARTSDPRAAADFVDLINPMIDIGTACVPSFAGFYWAVRNCSSLDAHSRYLADWLESW